MDQNHYFPRKLSNQENENSFNSSGRNVRYQEMANFYHRSVSPSENYKRLFSMRAERRLSVPAHDQNRNLNKNRLFLPEERFRPTRPLQLLQRKPRYNALPCDPRCCALLRAQRHDLPERLDYDSIHGKLSSPESYKRIEERGKSRSQVALRGPRPNSPHIESYNLSSEGHDNWARLSPHSSTKIFVNHREGKPHHPRPSREPAYYEKGRENYRPYTVPQSPGPHSSPSSATHGTLLKQPEPYDALQSTDSNLEPRFQRYSSPSKTIHREGHPFQQESSNSFKVELKWLLPGSSNGEDGSFRILEGREEIIELMLSEQKHVIEVRPKLSEKTGSYTILENHQNLESHSETMRTGPHDSKHAVRVAETTTQKENIEEHENPTVHKMAVIQKENATNAKEHGAKNNSVADEKEAKTENEDQKADAGNKEYIAETEK